MKSSHKYMKTSYPKSTNTAPLSFKRIMELTARDESLQSITEHVVDSILRFLDSEEKTESGEFLLTNEDDMFQFLSSHAA